MQHGNTYSTTFSFTSAIITEWPLGCDTDQYFSRYHGNMRLMTHHAIRLQTRDIKQINIINDFQKLILIETHAWDTHFRKQFRTHFCVPANKKSYMYTQHL